MIPTDSAGTAPATNAHPLIAQLFAKYGCTEITPENIDTAHRPVTLLVFLEDPLRIRERQSWRWSCQTRTCVHRAISHRRAAANGAGNPSAIRFQTVPALVMRDGAYVARSTPARLGEYVQTSRNCSKPHRRCRRSAFR
jgi:hypothetical protein